jgi:hypothetical protein
MLCNHPACDKKIPSRNHMYCSRECYKDHQYQQKMSRVCNHGYARGDCWRCRDVAISCLGCGVALGDSRSRRCPSCAKAGNDNARRDLSKINEVHVRYVDGGPVL